MMTTTGFRSATTVLSFCLAAAFATALHAERLVYDEYDGRAGGTVGWAREWPGRLKANKDGELVQTFGYQQRPFKRPVGKDGQTLWIAITGRCAAKPTKHLVHSAMGLRGKRKQIHQQNGLLFMPKDENGTTPFRGDTGIEATKKQTVLCRYTFTKSTKDPEAFDIAVSAWAGPGQGAAIDVTKPPIATGTHRATTFDRFYAGVGGKGLQLLVDRVAVATTPQEALEEGPVPPPPFDVSEKAVVARKAIYEVNGLAALAADDSPLRKDERISIFGDSITNQNRYVKQIQAAIAKGAKTRALGVTVFNRGINGGKVTDLIYGAKIYGDSQESFDSVLAADKPTVVVIYVGINDVMHRPGTSSKDYEAGLRHLVAKAQTAGAAVVLATPSVHNERPDGTNPSDAKIDAYSAIVRTVAADTKSALVDLRKGFIAYLQNHNITFDERKIPHFKKKGILTYDGIHPTPKGNELTANLIGAGIAQALRAGPQPKPATIPAAPKRPPTAAEIRAQKEKEELARIAANVGLKQLTGPETPLKAGTTVSFFGDSVTMQGGYIRTMRKALAVSPHTKELKVKLMQHGLNGGRVPTVMEGKSPWGKLGGTMQELLDRDKPNLVVIYLGINDVWHGAKGTTPGDFQAGLEKMLGMCKTVGAKVILATPTVIGEKPDGTNPHDKKLDQYAGITRAVAKDGGATFVDLREAFLAYLKEHNKKDAKGQYPRAKILTYDGVHMLPAGNNLLADRLSRGICDALKD